MLVYGTCFKFGAFLERYYSLIGLRERNGLERNYVERYGAIGALTSSIILTALMHKFPAYKCSYDQFL